MVSRLTCVCRNALEGSRLRRVSRVCNCVLAQKPSLHRACVQELRALVSKCLTVYVKQTGRAPHGTWVPGTGGQMGHLAHRRCLSCGRRLVWSYRRSEQGALGCASPPLSTQACSYRNPSYISCIPQAPLSAGTRPGSKDKRMAERRLRPP